MAVIRLARFLPKTKQSSFDHMLRCQNGPAHWKIFSIQHTATTHRIDRTINESYVLIRIDCGRTVTYLARIVALLTGCRCCCYCGYGAGSIQFDSIGNWGTHTHTHTERREETKGK